MNGVVTAAYKLCAQKALMFSHCCRQGTAMGSPSYLHHSCGFEWKLDYEMSHQSSSIKMNGAFITQHPQQLQPYLDQFSRQTGGIRQVLQEWKICYGI